MIVFLNVPPNKSLQRTAVGTGNFAFAGYDRRPVVTELGSLDE